MSVMGQQHVRDVFYCIDRTLTQTQKPGKEFEREFRNAYYGFAFAPTLISTKLQKMQNDPTINKLETSWNEFEYIDVNYLYPMLSSYDFYSPFLAIQMYHMLKNIPLPSNIEKCGWLTTKQVDLILAEQGIWLELKKSHGRK